MPPPASPRASRLRRLYRLFRTRFLEPRYRRFPGRDDAVLDCCVAYNVHGGYCIPLSSRHRNAARRILEGLPYEPETLAVLTALDPAGDLVHAGAYFGDFLPALSVSRSPEARVWAFEPNPENHRAATVTCLINGLANVVLRGAGLGDAPGAANLLTRDAEGRALGGASALVDEPRSRRTRAVEILRLDDAVPADRRIVGIHLDVEGSEERALAGALGTIERWRPTLVLETLPTEAWLEARLEPLGYAVRGRVGRNWHLEAGG